MKKVLQKEIIKNTRRRVLYAALLSLVTFVSFLPRRAALSMMRGLGGAAFYLLKSKRQRTLRHLRAAFGRERSATDIHRIARLAFSNFGAFVADAVLTPRLMGKGIDELIKAEGLEHLDSLSRNNEGAILLTAHFGNWELLAAWVAKRGYKLKVIAAPQTNQWINRLIADVRKGAGYESIERGKHTREILRALAEGYSIGVLIDQDTKADGVFVRFLNQWANTPVGPVRLARKYGLKIIPIFIRLKRDHTYQVEVMDPLPLEFTGDKRRDLIVNTQMCSEACEKMIRRHPEQWLWMMRRGNKQPEGETLEACPATP